MDALSYLRSLQANLEDRETHHKSVSDKTFSFVIDEELTQYEPFSLLKDKWILHPSGYSCTLGHAGTWVLEELKKGTDPEKLIADALAELTQNRISGIEISVLEGLSVNTEYDIAENLKICPNGDLPYSMYVDYYFSDHNFFLKSRNDNAACVQSFEIDPLIGLESDFPAILRRAEERAFERKLLHSALLLSSYDPIMLPATFTVYEPRKFTGPIAHFSEPLHSPKVISSTQVEPEDVKTNFYLLKSFKDQRIHIAIDRLAKARSSHDIISAAIDFGLVQEILCINDIKSEGELSLRIRTRAAWMLGHNVDDRIEASRLANLIYSARSKAAHTGTLDDKSLKKYDIVEANKFVTKLTKAILARGSFPDWNNLTFGGFG